MNLWEYMSLPISFYSGPDIFPDIDIEQIDVADMIIPRQIKNTPREMRLMGPEYAIVYLGISNLGQHMVELEQDRALIEAFGCRFI